MTDPKPQFGTDVRPSHGGQGIGVPAVVNNSSHKREFAGTLSSWAVMGDAFAAISETAAQLQPGFYQCEQLPNGQEVLRRMAIKTDDILKLPCEATDVLMRDFTTFWEGAKLFAERRLSCKRGLLLWGPPGSGKTSAVHSMAQHMIEEMGGIVVMADTYPELVAKLLKNLREVEPERPLIVLFEDIDALVDRFGEPQLLAMLDGEHQISNVINVATTNYPERLDKRFADRPGRFDRVQYVGMPKKDARRVYLKAKAGEEFDEVAIERYVNASEGWSIAHLRELVVAITVLKEDPTEVLNRLNDMHDSPASSQNEPGKKTMGFGI